MKLKPKPKKKSQIAIQFSWIFIIIAGALILIFFVSIVYKQKTVSEIRLSATILNQLETILTGSGLSSGTTNVIDTPKMEIEFICDDDGYSEYSIKGTSLTKETPTAVIFAPKTLKGKRLITWAQDFSAPFKVTNFLYLTSPNIRYIFVYNPADDFADKIFNAVPDELFKESITINQISNIQNLGHEQVKFVFFEGGNVELPDFFKKVDVSAIRITGGSIIFFEKSGLSLNPEGNPVSYIGMPSLYGAIFADDLVFYQCIMKKAFKRLNLIATVHAGRQQQLKSYFLQHPTPQNCNRLYHTEPTDDLPRLVSTSAQCEQNFETCIANIIFDINGIINEQDALIRRSCPLLY